MTKHANPSLEQEVSFQVTRHADAAFLFVDELWNAKAGLIEALRAGGLRVTASDDELVVSRPGGQIDTLELAATLRERGCTTAVVVPVVREAREPVTIQETTGKLETARGTLTIQLIPSVVALDGHPLSFTKTEERLLARLWGARGRAVAPLELAAAVWPGEAPSVKALRVHVSKLRPKLAEVGLRIDTLKGQGYRLGVVPASPVETHLVRERLSAPYRRKGVDLFIPRAGTLHSTGRRRAQTPRSGSPWWLAPVPLAPGQGARPA